MGDAADPIGPGTVLFGDKDPCLVQLPVDLRQLPLFREAHRLAGGHRLDALQDRGDRFFHPPHIPPDQQDHRNQIDHDGNGKAGKNDPDIGLLVGGAVFDKAVFRCADYQKPRRMLQYKNGIVP